MCCFCSLLSAAVWWLLLYSAHLSFQPFSSTVSSYLSCTLKITVRCPIASTRFAPLQWTTAIALDIRHCVSTQNFEVHPKSLVKKMWFYWWREVNPLGMTPKKQKAGAVFYYLYCSTCSSSHIMNCKVKKSRLIAENKFCVTAMTSCTYTWVFFLKWRIVQGD